MKLTALLTLTYASLLAAPVNTRIERFTGPPDPGNGSTNYIITSWTVDGPGTYSPEFAPSPNGPWTQAGSFSLPPGQALSVRYYCFPSGFCGAVADYQPIGPDPDRQSVTLWGALGAGNEYFRLRYENQGELLTTQTLLSQTKAKTIIVKPPLPGTKTKAKTKPAPIGPSRGSHNQLKPKASKVYTLPPLPK